MTRSEPTIYAFTVYRYGSKSFRSGENLDVLIGTAEYIEDRGDGSVDKWWRAEGHLWVEFDATEQINAWRERDLASWSARRVEKKWHVHVHGPDGTTDEWSSHATQAEAQSEANGLPAVYRAVVRHDPF